jgi:hypothetical protein
MTLLEIYKTSFKNGKRLWGPKKLSWKVTTKLRTVVRRCSDVGLERRRRLTRGRGPRAWLSIHRNQLLWSYKTFQSCIKINTLKLQHIHGLAREKLIRQFLLKNTWIFSYPIVSSYPLKQKNPLWFNWNSYMGRIFYLRPQLQNFLRSQVFLSSKLGFQNSNLVNYKVWACQYGVPGTMSFGRESIGRTSFSKHVMVGWVTFAKSDICANDICAK